MKTQDFKSLGITRQIAYINRLEETNRQKVEMIQQLEEENKRKDLNYEAVIKRTQCLVYINPQKNCEALKRIEFEREYGKPYKK